MAKRYTRQALIGMVIGGGAGVALVSNDDLFTQLVGCVAGCTTMLIAYVVLDFCAAIIRHRLLPPGRHREQTSQDDYDQRAYKMERNFMDDGKPW